jgi:hypothetical protein
MHSAGRYRDFREATRTTPQWYETDPADKAIETNRVQRERGAQARGWITRPVATGVYYPSNSYMSAMSYAHTQIICRAQQLANVAIDAFMAEKPNDLVQQSVRVQFAQLIASNMNVSAYSSNKSAKLASDIGNLTASNNDLVMFFVNRITYDPRRQAFADTGAAHAVDAQPPWNRRPLYSHGLPASLYDVRSNPLLVRPPYQDPTRTYGTIYSGDRRICFS